MLERIGNGAYLSFLALNSVELRVDNKSKNRISVQLLLFRLIDYNIGLVINRRSKAYLKL